MGADLLEHPADDELVHAVVLDDEDVHRPGWEGRSPLPGCRHRRRRGPQSAVRGRRVFRDRCPQGRLGEGDLFQPSGDDA